MNIRKTILLMTALVFGLGAAGIYYYTQYQAQDLDHVQAAPEEEHEGHAHEEGEHGEEGHVDVVKLTPEQVKEFEIKVVEAGPGSLDSGLNLTGEVKLNEDKLAHIVPKLAGVVREVKKSLGDEVKPGEVMAVLESRELASAKAKYLSAGERVALAQATFTREKNLWERKISAEKDYIEARQALAEARIAQREAEQELHALGFSDAQLAKLPTLSDEAMTRYEVVAPFKGTVIEKHVTLGEAVETNAGIFVVADLASVWVDFNVHQPDLPSVRKGQAVRLRTGAGQPETEATIAYVGPVVGAETRTAVARAIVDNPDGAWRPGQYVTGSVAFEQQTVPVLVPKAAIQNVEGEPSVFIESEEGFEPAPVTVGRSSETHQEIVAGLEAGQRYAATGSFVLKAALQKGELGHQH